MKPHMLISIFIVENLLCARFCASRCRNKVKLNVIWTCKERKMKEINEANEGKK